MGTTYMKTAPAAKTKAAPRAAEPTEAKGPTALYTLAAATLGGVLLWMCFQPLALGAYLGWIALVPFLVLVRSQARPRFVYFGAFVCGLAFFVPVLQWMRVADRSMAAAWIALATYCALYFPVALFCIRGLERWKLPLIVSVPLVWIALEYCRCFLLTGFPWYLLAHTQHDLLPMIQITDIGGVFLVTLVVAAVNAFLFDLAYQFPEVRQWFNQRELEPYRCYASVDILNRGGAAEWLFRRNLILEGLALAILLISTYSYGVARLGQDQFPPGPLVCLLQSNLDQRLRENANVGNNAETVGKHFDDLRVRAAFNHQPTPDLLIWPETSFPIPLYQTSPKFPIEKLNDKDHENWRDADIFIHDELERLALATKIPNLLGMNAAFRDEADQVHRFNSAVLLNAQGRIDGKFDKIHRVPFGEYVPLGDWLPFLRWLTPYEGPFGIDKGEKLTRFSVAGKNFGVLICYEDTDPSLARRYLEANDDGPPVDFFVNMSNDGWFDGSAEHEEHLAVSRFRAIECRRAMVRSVNMGVSAVIDGNGRVLKPKEFPGTKPPVWMVAEEKFGAPAPSWPVSEWHTFKQKQLILKANVPLDHRFSFYAATGDWLPISCWLALLTAAGWSLVRRRMAVKALA